MPLASMLLLVLRSPWLSLRPLLRPPRLLCRASAVLCALHLLVRLSSGPLLRPVLMLLFLLLGMLLLPELGYWRPRGTGLRRRRH